MNLLSLAEASTDSFRIDDNMNISNLGGSGILRSRSDPLRSSNVSNASSASENISFNMFANVGAQTRNKPTLSKPETSKRDQLHAPHLSASVERGLPSSAPHPHRGAPFEGEGHHAQTYTSGMDTKQNESARRSTDYISRVSASNIDAALNSSRESLSAAEVMRAGLSTGGAPAAGSQSAAGASKAVLSALQALQDKIRRVEAERSTAHEEILQLKGKVQAKDAEMGAQRQAAAAELENQLRKVYAKVSDSEAHLRDERERGNLLQQELHAAEDRNVLLGEKVSDQAEQLTALRARLDEAAAERQRLLQKEQEVAQTIVWESKRHEDERELSVKRLRDMEGQLVRARYECDALAARTKELDALTQTLLTANSGLRRESGSSNARGGGGGGGGGGGQEQEQEGQRARRNSSAGVLSDMGQLSRSETPTESVSTQQFSVSASSVSDDSEYVAPKSKGAKNKAASAAARASKQATKQKTVAAAAAAADAQRSASRRTPPPPPPAAAAAAKDAKSSKPVQKPAAKLPAAAAAAAAAAVASSKAPSTSHRRPSTPHKKDTAEDARASGGAQTRRRASSIDSATQNSVESAPKARSHARSREHSVERSRGHSVDSRDSVDSHNGGQRAQESRGHSSHKQHSSAKQSASSSSRDSPLEGREMGGGTHEEAYDSRPRWSTGIAFSSSPLPPTPPLPPVSAPAAKFATQSTLIAPQSGYTAPAAAPAPAPTHAPHTVHHHHTPSEEWRKSAHTQGFQPVSGTAPAFTPIHVASPVVASSAAPGSLAREDSGADAEIAAFSANTTLPYSAASEISRIVHLDESLEVVRTIQGSNMAIRANYENLEDLQSRMNDAKAAQRYIEHTGLGARPLLTSSPHASNANHSSPERERESIIAARARAAGKELGGTFGSPTAHSAINSILLQKSPVPAATGGEGVGSASSIIASGIKRGGTLDSVISSLEEEFTGLNNQYRKLLSACSSSTGTNGGGKQSEVEARNAEELVQVIHRLHRKGEQLRKLRVGSPSMNLFSSSASAAYVENMANTNIDATLNMSINSAGAGGNHRNSLSQSSGSSSSSAVKVPQTPRFVNPLPAAPYLKYSNSAPGTVAEMRDDVMDFDRQDLNATSLSSDSPSSRGM